MAGFILTGDWECNEVIGRSLWGLLVRGVPIGCLSGQRARQPVWNVECLSGSLGDYAGHRWNVNEQDGV